MSYNGWVNYETWVTNLHWDGYFEPNTDAETIKDTIEEYVYGNVDNPFVQDMVHAFLDAVDYDEIAETYAEED